MSPSDFIFLKRVVLWMPSWCAVFCRFQLFLRNAFIRNAASISLKERNSIFLGQSGQGIAHIGSGRCFLSKMDVDNYHTGNEVSYNTPRDSYNKAT